MINFVIWIVLGGLIGWLASMVMRTEGQSVMLNVIVGIVGSALAGWLLTPMLGTSSINQSNFSLPGLFISFLGAVILLAIVNLIRRGAVR